MKTKIWSLILIIFLSGCNQKSPFIELFEDKGSACYSIVKNSPDFIIRHPLRMIKVGSLFIISDFSGDQIFTVFNIYTGNTYRFGNRGRGPDNFNDGYGLLSFTDTTFFIFDRVLQRISFFNVKKDILLCYKKFSIPLVLNVTPYNDSTFITNGNPPFKGNYGVLDLNNSKIKSYIDYPSGLHDDLPDFIRSRIYYSHIVNKPGTSRFVSFKNSHHIIDILDYEEMKLKLAERKIFHHRKWETAGRGVNPSDKNRRNIFTAPRITGSDNRIFACYQDPKIDEGDDWHILTFDWNGNPLGRYSIPFDPYVITSVDDSTLYSLSLIGKEYRLVKIDI
jgi:hypothetical protein